MTRPGPRAVEVVLSQEERAELRRWVAGAAPRRFAERARIVLACGEGASNAAVATVCGVTVTTARKWRGRFAELRMAGLEDEFRTGRRMADLVLSESERA